jgi:hypothetical protein
MFSDKAISTGAIKYIIFINSFILIPFTRYPRKVAETSKIFLRDILPKLLSLNNADVTGGKAIAI